MQIQLCQFICHYTGLAVTEVELKSTNFGNVLKSGENTLGLSVGILNRGLPITAGFGGRDLISFHLYFNSIDDIDSAQVRKTTTNSSSEKVMASMLLLV